MIMAWQGEEITDWEQHTEGEISGRKRGHWGQGKSSGVSRAGGNTATVKDINSVKRKPHGFTLKKASRVHKNIAH